MTDSEGDVYDSAYERPNRECFSEQSHTRAERRDEQGVYRVPTVYLICDVIVFLIAGFSAVMNRKLDGSNLTFGGSSIAFLLIFPFREHLPQKLFLTVWVVARTLIWLMASFMFGIVLFFASRANLDLYVVVLSVGLLASLVLLVFPIGSLIRHWFRNRPIKQNTDL